MTLGIIWYALIALLIGGYAVLDGFDLGVGALYPFVAKTEQEKGALRTSIGPVWDGNEVWLLTGGGALFAAFPAVYATVFSGFYLALMIVLFCLIFRAVSLENRSSGTWTPFWDWAFFVGSALPALLFGVAMGNIVRGVPLDANGEFAGDFFTLLNPFALLIGLLSLSMFVTHGAAWAALKSEGALRSRAAAVRSAAHWVFVALVVVATAATALWVSDQPPRVLANPLGWVMLVLLVGGIVYTRLSIARDGDSGALLGSGVGILGLVGLVAVGNYPNLVPALDAPARSLTISNSASSHLTLTVMLIIAIIGVPIVLAYTALVYRSFWGRVSAGDPAGH